MALTAAAPAEEAQAQAQQAQQLQQPQQQQPSPVERLTGVGYYSRAQLEDDSPSRRDGISAAQEAEWRAEYTAIISEAGMRLRIPQWAIYTAAQLCHRFYAVRSMARNDRFLISAACLFLSAKLQEFPKRASDTALACDHVRFYPAYERAHAAWRARQQQAGQQGQQGQHRPPPQVFAVGAGAPPPPPPPSASAALEREPLRWWEERPHVQQRREELLVAERAVLFALNFALATAHPYASLLRWVAEMDWRRAAAAARGAQGGQQQGEEGKKEEEQGGGEGEAAAAASDEQQQRKEQLEQEEKRRAAALSRDVLHVAWNLVTDSARTQLALRHHPSKLAAAALYSAALVAGALPLPPLLKQHQEPEGGGGGSEAGAWAGAGEGAAGAEAEEQARAAFFRRYRITADELDDIVTEMMDASDGLCGGGGVAGGEGGAGGGGGEAARAAAAAAAANAKRRRLVDGGAAAS